VEFQSSELLTRPTVWLWRGNLVIFATNIVDAFVVEERLAQRGEHGELSKKAEFVISANYMHGGTRGHLTWHLDCDLVTMQSLFFQGKEGSDDFRFVPTAGSRTRIFAGRKPVDENLTGPTYAALSNMQSANLALARKIFAEVAKDAVQLRPNGSPILRDSEPKVVEPTQAVSVKSEWPASKAPQVRRGCIRG